MERERSSELEIPGDRILVLVFSDRTLDDPYAEIQESDSISMIELAMGLRSIEEIEDAIATGNLLIFTTETGEKLEIHPRNIHWKVQNS